MRPISSRLTLSLLALALAAPALATSVDNAPAANRGVTAKNARQRDKPGSKIPGTLASNTSVAGGILTRGSSGGAAGAASMGATGTMGAGSGTLGSSGGPGGVGGTR